MAYAKIRFQNPNTGAIKDAPVGFSWTTAFFGIFPALFRGDWKFGVIQLLLAIITLGFSHLVFMFIYNKLYIKGLIGNGFKAESISDDNFEKASSSVGMAIPLIHA